MKLVSPIDNQDFIWLAEYTDGSHLAEFDLDTCKENSFYSIDRNNLIRFGMIGHNIKMYCDIFGGQFNVNGISIDFLLKDIDGIVYPITGKNEMYKEIITFKDAESCINMSGRIEGSRITKYNFGYKKLLEYDELKIKYKNVITIPYKNPSYINFRLVCDKDFKGELLVKYVNRIVESIPCDFSKDIGYEFNWIMK